MSDRPKGAWIWNKEFNRGHNTVRIYLLSTLSYSMAVLFIVLTIAHIPDEEGQLRASTDRVHIRISHSGSKAQYKRDITNRDVCRILMFIYRVVYIIYHLPYTIDYIIPCIIY